MRRGSSVSTVSCQLGRFTTSMTTESSTSSASYDVEATGSKKLILDRACGPALVVLSQATVGWEILSPMDTPRIPQVLAGVCMPEIEVFLMFAPSDRNGKEVSLMGQQLPNPGLTGRRSECKSAGPATRSKFHGPSIHPDGQRNPGVNEERRGDLARRPRLGIYGYVRTRTQVDLRPDQNLTMA